MATTEPDLPKADQPVRGSVFTWIATVLACAYIVWSGTMLYLATPTFIDMYKSMGVELPLSTRIVIAVYRFAYPLLFGGATALVITKQFYVREKWISLGITLSAVLVVEIMSRGTVSALYHPLFDMVEKLNK
jgi:type II secretory pathway component PulF